MLNLKDLSRAVKQVADEKGLPAEKVLDAIESSIAAAYKKEYGERGEVIRAKLDLKTGELKFWRVKTVVDASTVRFVGQEEAEGGGGGGRGGAQARAGRGIRGTGNREPPAALQRGSPHFDRRGQEHQSRCDARRGTDLPARNARGFRPHRRASGQAGHLPTAAGIGAGVHPRGMARQGRSDRERRGPAFRTRPRLRGSRPGDRSDVRERIHTGGALPHRRTPALPGPRGPGGYPLAGHHPFPLAPQIRGQTF